MKTIEVKSCLGCHFRHQGFVFEVCSLDSSIMQSELPYDQVHENCPLKTESVTVKLKEE